MKCGIKGYATLLFCKNNSSKLWLSAANVPPEKWPFVNNPQQMAAIRTWLRGPLKNGNAPLSLRDSNRELVHAVGRQRVDHRSPLGAVLELPASWLTLLPVPNCVGPENEDILSTLFTGSPFPLNVHLVCWSHLEAPGATFPISTAGSTQEMRTDLGDKTLTLMSRASYSGGSGHTQSKISNIQYHSLQLQAGQ